MMKTQLRIAMSVALFPGSMVLAENVTWNGTEGDWVTNHWIRADSSLWGAPTVGSGMDLFLNSGRLTVSDNNTWIDNDPGLTVKWGGASMTISGGVLQQMVRLSDGGGKNLRIGEKGTGVLTQSGGIHYITAPTAVNTSKNNVQVRIATSGGNGLYDLQGGLLTNMDTAGLASGNIGIGSANATGRLEVSGTAQVDLGVVHGGNSTGDVPALMLQDSTGGSASLEIVGDGVTIDIATISIEGATNHIKFDFGGGSAVSPVNVTGAFTTLPVGVYVATSVFIDLENYAGPPATIDLITAASGFSAPPDAFVTTSPGWSVGLDGTGTILQASNVPAPGPLEITAFSPLGGGSWQVALKGEASTNYKLTEAADLDFASATDISYTTIVTGSVVDATTFATDASGNALVNFPLAGTRNFVRADPP